MNSVKLFLLLLMLVVTNCAKEQENFFVYNQDTEIIDSLHIYVRDETYLIENLQPKRTQSIYIHNIGGDVKIMLQANHEAPMSLNSGFLDPQANGTLKIMITRNRIVAKTSHPN